MDVERFAALGVIGVIVVLFMRYAGKTISTTSISNMFTSSSNNALKSKDDYIDDVSADKYKFSSDRVLSAYEVSDLAVKMNERFNLTVGARGLLSAAYIESSFYPRARRFEPHLGESSIGIMQTLVSTAQWLHRDMGYRDYAFPTESNLTNPVISMYYGAAYFHWLQRAYPGKDMEWYVRAYNGGPGHKYNSMTTNHWNKFKDAFNQFNVIVRFGS